ncbi:hypothetical protein [Micromonospora sp. NPDC023888]|uniref:hypothetical protein n=1 Tax=Micromonospora sp. NPDC023888 TaxID=3155607 RepID=UPI0033C9A599
MTAIPFTPGDSYPEPWCNPATWRTARAPFPASFMDVVRGQGRLRTGTLSQSIARELDRPG